VNNGKFRKLPIVWLSTIPVTSYNRDRLKSGNLNMNVKNVINQLKSQYPGKPIIKNNKGEPTEILCEIDPTKNHPGYSLAIAVIDKSTPHYHKKLKEEYRIIRGNLILHVDNRVIRLKHGEKHIILPYQIHWAEGNQTWIECRSEPGWVIEDHIFSN